MINRIIGSESEFGLTKASPEISAEFKSKEWLHKLASRFQIISLNLDNIANFFFYNGGRYTREQTGILPPSQTIISCTPEYATPECQSLSDIVIWEKAGEQIFSRLYDLENADSGLTLLKHGRGLDENKHEPEYTTSGHHENYSFPFNVATLEKLFYDCSSPSARKLITFLVSRVILNGAGMVNIHNKPLPFELSFRSPFIEKEFSINTTNSRPIIFTSRQTDTFGTANMSRTQIIMGDHNMSEMAIYLTFGTTALVLRMLETDFLDNCPMVSDGVDVLKSFSRDPYLKNRVNLLNTKPGANIRSATALDIQDYFCTQAGKFLAQQGGTQEERELQAYWHDVLIRLRLDVFALKGELDWVTKLALIKSYLAKNHKSFDNLYGTDPEDQELREKCIGLDLGYHDISKNGFYNRLVAKGKIKRLVTDEQIENAIINPPLNTRAKIRSDFLNFLTDNEVPGKCADNWSRLELNLKQNKVAEIEILNPFENSSEIWDSIKRSYLAERG